MLRPKIAERKLRWAKVAALTWNLCWRKSIAFVNKFSSWCFQHWIKSIFSYRSISVSVLVMKFWLPLLTGTPDLLSSFWDETPVDSKGYILPQKENEIARNSRIAEHGILRTDTVNEQRRSEQLMCQASEGEWKRVKRARGENKTRLPPLRTPVK